MRIWFDTEFIDDGVRLELISIGMVREDGFELYLENAEVDWSRAGEWVLKNVRPKLLSSAPGFRSDPAVVSRAEMARRVRSFASYEKPEFWAYFASYDWVLLCRLFGRMLDLPPSWPQYCNDLRQEINALDPAMTPAETEAFRETRLRNADHNALTDARWLRGAWHHVEGLKEARRKASAG